jgi:hypothetical protein
LKECPILPFPCNILRATEIDVNSIAIRFDNLGCSKKFVRVIGTELHDEWTVNRWVAFLAASDVKVIITIEFIRLLGEHLLVIISENELRSGWVGELTLALIMGE